MDEKPPASPQYSETGGGSAPRRHSIRKKADIGRFKRFFVITGGIILLLGASYEAYRVLTRKSKPVAPKPVAQQSTNTVAQSVPKDVPDAGATKPYKNMALGVEFTYPDTWKVSETADSGLRIESPAFSFTSSDEGNVNGLFRIYIRKGARTSDSKYLGRGYAVAPSEKLTYTNPANDQRKETLITQFGFDEPSHFSYFFIAGNFQLAKGDTLGPDYGKEPETFIIAGGFSGEKLTDDMQMYSVATDIPTSSNAYKQAIGILASLKLH